MKPKICSSAGPHSLTIWLTETMNLSSFQIQISAKCAIRKALHLRAPQLLSPTDLPTGKDVWVFLNTLKQNDPAYSLHATMVETQPHTGHVYQTYVQPFYVCCIWTHLCRALQLARPWSHAWHTRRSHLLATHPGHTRHKTPPTHWRKRLS